MTARPKSTTWRAEPHTIAKIDILRAYLDAWFQIMGRSQRGHDILYIDGFAGPGSYTNHAAGSPLAALAAANEARRTAGAGWVAGNIHLAFFEEDQNRIAILRENLGRVPGLPNGFIYLFDLPFSQSMLQLQAAAPQFFTSRLPVFAFIDPFGVKGFTFRDIERLLASPLSEVLINFDADGVARVLRAGETADRDAILDAVFGYEDWRTELDQQAPMSQLVRQCMDLYRRRLLSLERVRFVFPFEMRKHRNSIDYFLVFASQHALGLEKMKEAMRRVDKSGAYNFCDAAVGQNQLFRFDDPAQYADTVWRNFMNQTVGLEAIRDFVLTDTPFITPNKVLAELERSGRLTVVSRKSTRRRGTFKPEDIVALNFSTSTHESS